MFQHENTMGKNLSAEVLLSICQYSFPISALNGKHNLIPMGLILISKDPVALDSVFCHLIYLDPSVVATNTLGERYGLGTWHEKNIDIITPDGKMSMNEIVVKYGNTNFNVYRKPARPWVIEMIGTALRPFSSKPYINKDKCIKCGICVDSCPVEGKAVKFVHGKNFPPEYDYGKCIRCFCCQEQCPQRAIDVKRPLGLGTRK